MMSSSEEYVLRLWPDAYCRSTPRTQSRRRRLLALKKFTIYLERRGAAVAEANTEPAAWARAARKLQNA